MGGGEEQNPGRGPQAQKLLTALEAKWKTNKVTSGSGSGPKGVPKDVGAPEKGKGVEWPSCDCCTARGVVCEVSPYPGARSDSEQTFFLGAVLGEDTGVRRLPENQVVVFPGAEWSAEAEMEGWG